MPKISVIIPVYGVEKYIEHSARSLFEQTLDDIEYIFIDDCSPDRSMDVLTKLLEQYPQRVPQTIIVRNEKNMGVGQTRQRGIDMATGDYLIHCDPDDWVALDIYEKLYTLATKENADIAICAYTEMVDDKATLIKEDFSGESKDLFHRLAIKQIHSGLWNKLIRSYLIKRFKIHPGINLMEDFSIVAPALLSAKKIVYTHEGLYFYRRALSTSVSNNHSEKDFYSQIQATQSFLSAIKGMELNLDPTDMALLQWNAKSGLFKFPTKSNRQKWLETFPEANDYMHIPISILGKFLSWCMTHNQLSMLKLSYKIKQILGIKMK